MGYAYDGWLKVIFLISLGTSVANGQLLGDCFKEQGQFGEVLWCKADTYIAPAVKTGTTRATTIPGGSIEIQHKNLCQASHNGGWLYQVHENWSSRFPVKVVNNEIYIPTNGYGGPGGFLSVGLGLPIHKIGSPFPENGDLIRLTQVYFPLLYIYGMACYYQQCASSNLNGSPCTVTNLHFTELNYSTEQPKIDLSIIANSFSADNGNVTKDGKFSVKPGEENKIYFEIKGENFDQLETRSAEVKLKIGDAEPIAKTISVSEIKENQRLIVEFPYKFDIDQAGEQRLQASVSISGDSNTSNNILEDKMYVLCNIADKGKIIPFYQQGGTSEWANDDYANQAPSKMKDLGCYTSSFAMVMYSYGIQKSADGESKIDPGSVNVGLMAIGFYDELGPEYQAYHGYTESGGLNSFGAVNFARASYAKNCILAGGLQSECISTANEKISFIGRSDTFLEADQKNVYKQLCEGNPMILKVSSRNPSNSHFVVAKGMTVNKEGVLRLETNNPGTSDGENFEYNVTDISGYRSYKQIADPTMLSIHLTGGYDMVVTDSTGKKSGYDPISNISYSEILGATYTLPESIGSPDDPNISTPPEATFEFIGAGIGNYDVQVFKNTNSADSFKLTKYSTDPNGNVNAIETKTGSESGANFMFAHSDHTLPVRYSALSISKSLFLDTVRKDKAFISGRIIMEDKKPITKINKFMTAKLGSSYFKIDLAKLKKLKLFGSTYFFYHDWGRKGVTFELNGDTGVFLLYIDNVNLDASKPELRTSLEIHIDEIKAENMITFKEIPRRHNGK